jgi:UDP-glucose 4-epimerase
MRYLITGGAGFIGSHLAEFLIEQGHHVHVIDNLSTGTLDNIQHLFANERFDFTIGNVLDYNTLERQVQKCDQIFHLAAAVGVKLIMDEPVETIITNVQGTENVLKLANYYRKKVLVASTSEVYGKSMDNNDAISYLSEENDWTLGPTTKRRWAYACSKAIDEFLAFAYHDEKQLPVVVVRFFNTVGPRQTGRYGMVIPNFVQRALRGEPIQVFGDGEQSRCFTHVRDAVRAIVGLMDTPAAEGQIFNVGSEGEITMNELAQRVCALTGSKAGYTHVPYHAVYGDGFEDMRRRTPDISKLAGAIGYKPQFNIEDILRDVIKYYTGQKDEAALAEDVAGSKRNGGLPKSMLAGTYGSN